jgi:hypothetical protein
MCVVDDRSADMKRQRPYQRARMLSGFGRTLAGIQADAGKALKDMDSKMDRFRARKRRSP